MNLTAMASYIKSILNVSGETPIDIDTIYAAINDGYKDVCAKAFCNEHIDKLHTVEDCRIIKFSGHRVNRIRLDSLVSENQYYFQDDDYEWEDDDYEWNGAPTELLSNIYGLIEIKPQLLGHVPICLNHPQYYFTWGNYIIIEPLPDDAYMIDVYVADYPDEQLTSGTDVPSIDVKYHKNICLFAAYALSLKMRRWKAAITLYKEYILSLKYINRLAGRRILTEIPEGIKWQQ